MEPIVIARAPGHLSLGYPDSADGAALESEPYMMVSAAISYYAYTIISASRAADLDITIAGHSPLLWRVPDHDSGYGCDLSLPKAIAQMFGIRERLSVFLSAQAPIGIGLGLSSGLTVSMIKALAFACGLDLEPTEVANLACHIREQTLHLPCRGQRQYAAAHGGLSSIVTSTKDVKVEPLRLSPVMQASLQEHLMLFGAPGILPAYGYEARSSQTSSREALPVPASGGRWKSNQRVRTLLERGDWEALGELLHTIWLERRCPASRAYDSSLAQGLTLARSKGAWGGQGTHPDGGLLLILCPVERQAEVAVELAVCGLEPLPISLESEGVQVMEAAPHAKLATGPSLRDSVQLGNRLLHMR
jgi:D-glycero-alpha-D-manno-heptose-7-phosphate kinase